ncbi:MAG TPA: hypothetical protein DEB39_16485 [Planctomycetaceae bacterium]|nr:hypothetical protein [Planctomycetaceae bacterium]
MSLLSRYANIKRVLREVGYFFYFSQNSRKSNASLFITTPQTAGKTCPEQAEEFFEITGFSVFTENARSESAQTPQSKVGKKRKCGP